MSAQGTPAIAPYRFPASRAAQITFALLAVYVVYALTQLDVSLERVQQGMAHAGRFLGRMIPPNFARSDA